MSLPSLTKPWQPISYGFLDASAKREIRHKMLKAVAVPGCQMPYASHEVPTARGWGIGGMQVSLTLITPTTCVKVIDQGADDSVNAVSIRRFLTDVPGAPTTLDTLQADLMHPGRKAGRRSDPCVAGAKPGTAARGATQYVDCAANACGG